MVHCGYVWLQAKVRGCGLGLQHMQLAMLYKWTFAFTFISQHYWSVIFLLHRWQWHAHLLTNIGGLASKLCNTLSNLTINSLKWIAIALTKAFQKPCPPLHTINISNDLPTFAFHFDFFGTFSTKHDTDSVTAGCYRSFSLGLIIFCWVTFCFTISIFNK